MQIRVLVHLEPEAVVGEVVGLPVYRSAGASGMDLRAARPSKAHPWRVYGGAEQTIVGGGGALLRLFPGQRALIPTGIRMQIPKGFEGQVRPRSGWALKHGLSVCNSPGTIDADFRGVVGVILVHHGMAPVDISPGDRIAQIVFAPVARAALQVVDELEGSERGSGSFGSTGV